MARQPRLPAKPQPLPADVRLMRTGASVLFAFALLAFIGLLLTWALRAPLFTLRGVRVEGEVARNSVTTIRANAMPKLSGNFFSLDLAQAQEAFQSVPWVRRAAVQRVWPNRLAVRLEEHRVAALGDARGAVRDDDELHHDEDEEDVGNEAYLGVSTHGRESFTVAKPSP